MSHFCVRTSLFVAALVFPAFIPIAATWAGDDQAIQPLLSNPCLERKFQAADTDQDGVISRPEAAVMVQKLETFGVTENCFPDLPTAVPALPPVPAPDGQAAATPAPATLPSPTVVEVTPVRPLVPGALTPGRAKKYSRRDAAIAVDDLNMDGKLQPAEAQASIQRKFTAADTDQDGKISEAESAAMVARFRQDNAESYGILTGLHTKKFSNKVKDIDTNEDGSISAAEYGSFYSDRYQRMDRDGDGAIGVKEYRGDTERLKKSKE
ncbi:MAG: EF-hand domain-containing protein [Micavibrio sp.]